MLKSQHNYSWRNCPTCPAGICKKTFSWKFRTMEQIWKEQMRLLNEETKARFDLRQESIHNILYRMLSA